MQEHEITFTYPDRDALDFDLIALIPVAPMRRLNTGMLII
jgi:hypothetical protein